MFELVASNERLLVLELAGRCVGCGQLFAPNFTPPIRHFSLYVDVDSLYRVKHCLPISGVNSGERSAPHPTHRPANLKELNPGFKEHYLYADSELRFTSLAHSLFGRDANGGSS